MRVALLHSWLNQYGGAERVLEVLHEMYPTAPVYTSMYLPRAMPDAYRSWDLRLSFIQHLPLVKTHHQPFLALYPLAFEQFDLQEYDLVISNSSAFCHGALTRPETCHICYCLTPARFLWSYPEYARREHIPRLAGAILPFVLNYLRTWDALAAQRVDHFVAISQTVAHRIRKYYGRTATVIHPPVDTAAFQPSSRVDDYFLIVSRLVPYKRIDLAVEAFNQLGLPLKIAGDGRDRSSLQALARPNIEFLGRVSDEAARELYAGCRALVFPGEEDFGLAPLEAQAAGRPVIAYAAGGALETVEDGQTGVFFSPAAAEALVEAVRRFETLSWDSQVIQRHAQRFDRAVFQERFRSFVEEKYAEHQAGVGRCPEASHWKR